MVMLNSSLSYHKFNLLDLLKFYSLVVCTKGGDDLNCLS
jgi:hypothetical protein